MHPRDFGVREPRRANAKSAIAERRESENRSRCGRRTSLQGDTLSSSCGHAALATVYPQPTRNAILACWLVRTLAEYSSRWLLAWVPADSWLALAGLGWIPTSTDVRVEVFGQTAARLGGR